MKNYIALILLSVVTCSANAADIACNGTITWVMADNASCTDSSGKKQIAYKHSTGDSWLCSGSDSASSLILSAKIAAVPVTVYINNNNGETCQVHGSYVKASYIIIK